MPAPPPTKPPAFAPSGGPNSGKERPATRPPSAPKPVEPGEKTKDFFRSAPKLEVPKGGGAVKGIGEKFQANPVTGTASLSVPISLSPGRQGFQPSLSLSYDSGAGNGPFGLGWSLSLPRIQRKTDKGLPEYRDSQDSDTFVLSEAEDLVPCLVWDSTSSTWKEPTLTNASDGTFTWSRRRYRPRVDAAIARIERWTETTTGEVHWRTWTRENVCRVYGLSSTSRLADPDDDTRVFAWYLEEERDETGNRIQYEYVSEDRQGAPNTPAEAMRSRDRNGCTYLYLKRVLYGNTTAFTDNAHWLFEVVLDYGEHPGEATDLPLVPPSHDETLGPPWAARQDIFSSFRSRFDVRCYRLCERVLVYHRFDDPTGLAEPTLVRSTEFAYTASAVATTLTSITVRGWRYDTDSATWTTLALPSVDFTYREAVRDESVQFVEGVDDLPLGLDTSRWRWVDLDGDGMAGLLAECGSGWYYKRNNGGGELAATRAVPLRPIPGSTGGLADVDGDGQMELIVHEPGMHGYAARDDEDNWQALRLFRGVPNVDWDDPNLRQLDLDGDGLPDVLLTEHDCLTWYPSEGRDGWSEASRWRKPPDEDDGPRLVFSSEREAIFLADMDGDGLTDLVRVRAGRVEYWPNRGMGRFGGRVVMANAPWFDRADRFDPKRVRFADVDGSGPSDLIYLGPDRVRIWQNQCGNSFDSREGTELSQFPGIDSASSVQVADVLGDGTACLVWSSPLLRDAWCPLRYVHLMAEGKPYLLKSITNNLGRVTTLSYAPSTQFMADDRAAGTPWATRLPFPVQCLQTVEVRDDVTGWRNTTTYAYHHGYYDGAEREFRGFGKVEQWDTEQLGTYESSSRGASAALDLDPVRTVSWFHTGAWRKQGTLEDAYGQEYWNEDPTSEAWPTDNATEDAPVTGATWPSWKAAERREAARALKGKLLRLEVYAEDTSASRNLPYAVTATTWTVARVQPVGDGDHACFIVVPRESLARHYERDADDPRTGHELTLDYDEHGIVTEKATVGYPRRDVSGRRDEQNDLCVLVAESEVIHDTSAIDTESDPDAMHWHVGVTSRATSWHLTKDTWQTSGVWNFTDLALFDRSTIAAALSAASEIPFEQSASTGTEKRAIAIEARRYWKDDLTGAAAAGTMESRALVYQAYRKAITSGLASATYTSLPSTSDFGDAGYVDLDGDGDWWVASGTATLDSAQFYQPTTFTDPFGNDTDVVYDSWSYFVLSATDAVGNEAVVTMDMVALQPDSVEDANDNVTLVAYDALGRVTAIAVQGKTTESFGDTLAAPTIAYAYELSSVPARVIVTLRTEHGGSNFLYRYTYSDGGGNVVQEKISAEPGDVGGTYASTRWVGTGRTVLNNKGLPVKQYEPFFSTTAAYEFEDEVAASGVSSTVYYDPLGRTTKVELPNGCLRKVTFTPWERAFSDENDTSADSDCSADAGLKARATLHAGTPTTVYLDHLGRPVATKELPNNTGTTYTTTLMLDVGGNPIVVNDARGIDTQTQTFDLLGRPLGTVSPDAGTTTTFLDVSGQPIRTWKSGDLLVEQGYDALRRPTTMLVTEGAATPRLVIVNEYGEGQGTTLNHRGRLYRQWDPAGRVEKTSYDFKGNLTTEKRQFWDWQAGGEEVTWGDDAGDTPATTYLESEEFPMSWEYDALNRVTSQETPDGSVTAFTYNEASLLEAVAATLPGASSATDFVTDIAYNARGQREAITYGNGVETAYTYEAETFRLSTLTTTYTSGTDTYTYQQLAYTYDPVGNIVSIEDTADETNNAGLGTTVYFNNGAITPKQEFEYDALYRLIWASGREKTELAYVDPGDEPAFGNRPDVASAVQRYEQTYTYDQVGNIGSMVHFVSGGSPYNWTRTYAYATDSNRLQSTTVGSTTQTFTHDDRGSITYLPNLRFSSSLSANVVPDFRDQIRKVLLATSGQYALYFYDAAGQRVRKVVVTDKTTERIYVGGVWERWRDYGTGTSAQEERETLHVMDGQQRLCLVETLTVTGGIDVSSPAPVLRYQLGNHLGTVAVELDDSGGVISYEEYHPYGTTAWRAPDLSTVSQKRYRYTGMERDEESGIQCHGMRYYATWLGRWLSADPIRLQGGINAYAYTDGNPIGLCDQLGLSPQGDAAVARARSTEVRAAADADAAQTVTETGKPLQTARPYAELPPEAIEAAIEVSAQFKGKIAPEEVLALWVQEGGRFTYAKDIVGASTIWAYSDADAKSIARSALLYKGHGMDQFTLYTEKKNAKGELTGDNVLVLDPGSGGQHDRAFDKAAAGYIARGLLPADYRKRVDAAVRTQEQFPGQVEPSRQLFAEALEGKRLYRFGAGPELLKLTMMGQAAVYLTQRERAKEAIPGAGANDIQAMAYVGFNIPSRIGALASHGGTGAEIAAWAFHDQVEGAFADSRTKGANFAFLVRSYARLF